VLDYKIFPKICAYSLHVVQNWVGMRNIYLFGVDIDPCWFHTMYPHGRKNNIDCGTCEKLPQNLGCQQYSFFFAKSCYKVLNQVIKNTLFNSLVGLYDGLLLQYGKNVLTRGIQSLS
jgi:hypothetical protein